MEIRRVLRKIFWRELSDKLGDPQGERGERGRQKEKNSQKLRRNFGVNGAALKSCH